MLQGTLLKQEHQDEDFSNVYMAMGKYLELISRAVGYKVTCHVTTFVDSHICESLWYVRIYDSHFSFRFDH